MTQSERAQTGAQLLVRCLEAQGVPFVFGIPGGAISPILEALGDGGPRFITVRHETAGAFMAQAYGRCTGRPGVVLTTSGPGLINAVCGVATAQADRDPVVAITGQLPRTMRFKSYHQDLYVVPGDQVELDHRWPRGRHLLNFRQTRNGQTSDLSG